MAEPHSRYLREGFVSQTPMHAPSTAWACLVNDHSPCRLWPTIPDWMLSNKNIYDLEPREI